MHLAGPRSFVVVLAQIAGLLLSQGLASFSVFILPATSHAPLADCATVRHCSCSAELRARHACCCYRMAHASALAHQRASGKWWVQWLRADQCQGPGGPAALDLLGKAQFPSPEGFAFFPPPPYQWNLREDRHQLPSWSSEPPVPPPRPFSLS